MKQDQRPAGGRSFVSSSGANEKDREEDLGNDEERAHSVAGGDRSADAFFTFIQVQFGLPRGTTPKSTPVTTETGGGEKRKTVRLITLSQTGRLAF